MSLSQLPVTELNLENTNKFLSQVGNFSHSLARRFANGEKLTSDDRENLVKLLNHAESLSGEIWGVETMVAGGHLNFEDVVSNMGHIGDNTNYPGHISSGFDNVENAFEDYPELIYDGPFSDHIMQMAPRMLSGAAAVSKEQSLLKAREVSGVSTLDFSSESDGRMPSYTYKSGNTSVSITKDGGFFSYMLKYRQIDEKAVSIDRAIELAEDYLAKVGYDNMVHTYYELNGGICTINFAGYTDGHTIYTDMIKVGVALDNGEIMSLDARAFITAHRERDLGEPTVSEKEARRKISPHLTIRHSKTAVIPSSGQNEVFCHEFLCDSDNGNQVLVYVNAHTGNEEQILLLRISDNGTLVV
jgi:germination protein YpeB